MKLPVRKIFTSLSEEEYLKKEKDRIIRRILTLFEKDTNYLSLNRETQNKIRNIVLDELNSYYRLAIKEHVEIQG